MRRASKNLGSTDYILVYLALAISMEMLSRAALPTGTTALHFISMLCLAAAAWTWYRSSHDEPAAAHFEPPVCTLRDRPEPKERALPL